MLREAQKVIRSREPQLLFLGTTGRARVRSCPRGCSTSRCRARAKVPCRSSSNPSSRPSTSWSSVAPRWPTCSPSWPMALGWKGRVVRRRGADPRGDGRALDRGRRHPGSRRRGGARARGDRAARPSSGWWPRTSAAWPCWSTSPSAASPRSSSTACTPRSGWTSGTPRTGRSPSPCSPSWSSCGRPARSPSRARRRGPVVSRRHEAIDPVCGMTVTVDASGWSTHTVEHDGTTYHFCCRGLPRAVRRRPAPYLPTDLADQEA